MNDTSSHPEDRVAGRGGRVMRAAAVTLFTILGANGVVRGTVDARGVANAAQVAQVALQVAYGVAGLAIAGLVWRRVTLPRWLLVAWTIAVVMAGALAVVAWGEAGWGAGALAGAGTLAVAGALAWLARRADRA